jgi:hypothetical protein
MIPKENSPLRKDAKFAILEVGDIIEENDEYYNPIVDMWLPVQKDFIDHEWNPDESKPVRRRLKSYKLDAADLILVENTSTLCIETKATLEKDGYIHVVIQKCSKDGTTQCSKCH